MTRQFEVLNDSAGLFLDAGSSFNGISHVRSFMRELSMGGVRLTDSEEVARRLPYGDCVDPRNWYTPNAAEALASLPEVERTQLKLRIAQLVWELRQAHPELTVEFPGQFN